MGPQPNSAVRLDRSSYILVPHFSLKQLFPKYVHEDQEWSKLVVTLEMSLTLLIHHCSSEEFLLQTCFL